MGTNESVNVQFNATLGGNTQSTFKAMADGFKKLAASLQTTAKGLLDLQQTEAASAIGHVSLAVNKMAASFEKAKSSTTDATKNMSAFAAAELKFANSSQVAQQAWAVFSKEVKNGSMSLSTAVTRASEYDRAMSNLVADIKLVRGQSSSLSKDIDFSTIAMLQQNNALKVSGGRFKEVTDEAYKYLITNKNTVASLKELENSQTLYNRTLRNARAAKVDDGNVKAIQDLGKQTAYSAEKLKVLFPVLSKVETNLTKLKVAEKALLDTNGSWVKSVDRVNLVNQTLTNTQKGVTQHVAMTTNGFKILSMDGLKPFGNLSLETAGKLGMLDTSYTKFLNHLIEYQAISGKNNAEMKTMRDLLTGQGQSFATAAEGVRKYITEAKQLDKNSVRVGELVNKYRELFQAESKHAQAANALIANLRQQPTLYNQTSESLKRLNIERIREAAEVKKLADGLLDLRSKYSILINSQSEYGRKAQEVLDKTAKGSSKLVEARHALRDLNASYTEALRIQKKYAESLSLIDSAMARLGQSFKSYTSYVLSAEVLQFFTSAMGAATTAIIEHDQALHNLKAIMQASAEDVVYMDKALLQVASDTKFSMTEVGQAMTQMGQAGFTASETVAGIPNVANLATGTLETLSNTVDLVGTAIRVFHMNMSETGKVADIFANAVTGSRLTIEGLNTAFNYIGPIAESAGLSLKDTAKATMVLANAGIKFSTIGTGMRQVLNLLLEPSKEFTEAVLSSGQSMQDFDPLISDFTDIMKRLPSVIGNARDALNMFGLRGSTIVTAFARVSEMDLQIFEDKLNSTGTASEMAEEQMKGLEVILKNISDRFGVLADSVGKAGITQSIKVILESFRDLLGVLDKVANTGIGQVIIAFTAFTVAIGISIGSIALLGKTFLKLVPIMGSLITSMTLLSLRATGMKIALINILGAYSANAAGAITLSGALQLLRARFLALLSGPLGWIVIAVTAVTAAFAVQYAITKQYLTSLTEVAIKQKEYSLALEKVREKLTKYNEIVKEHGKDSKRAQEAGKDLKESVTAIETSYKNAGGTVAEYNDYLEQSKGTSEEIIASSAKLETVIGTDLVNAYQKLYTAAAKLTSAERQAEVESLGYKWKTVLGFIQKVWEADGDGAFNTVLPKTQEAEVPSTKVPTGVNEAVSAYKKVEEAAARGEESAKKTIEVLSDLAQKYITEFNGTHDVAKMSTEELNGFILSVDKMNNQIADPAGLGLLIDRFGKFRESLIKSESSIGQYSTKLRGGLIQISMELDRLAKKGPVDMEQLVKLFEYQKKALNVSDFEELRKVSLNWFTSLGVGDSQLAVINASLKAMGETAKGSTTKFDELSLAFGVLAKQGTDFDTLTTRFTTLADAAKSTSDVKVLSSIFNDITKAAGLSSDQIGTLKTVLDSTASKVDTVFESLTLKLENTRKLREASYKDNQNVSDTKYSKTIGSSNAQMKPDKEAEDHARKLTYLAEDKRLVNEYFAGISSLYAKDTSEYASAQEMKSTADAAWAAENKSANEAASQVRIDSLLTKEDVLGSEAALAEYAKALAKTEVSLEKVKQAETDGLISKDEALKQSSAIFEEVSALELASEEVSYKSKKQLLEIAEKQARFSGESQNLKKLDIELSQLENEHLSTQIKIREKAILAIQKETTATKEKNAADELYVQKKLNSIEKDTVESSRDGMVSTVTQQYEIDRKALELKHSTELAQIEAHTNKIADIEKAKSDHSKQMLNLETKYKKEKNAEDLSNYTMMAEGTASIMEAMHSTGLVKSKSFFKSMQAFQYASTLISTYAAAQEAYKNAQWGTGLAGMALGAANMAAAIAVGLKNLAVIKAQSFAYGGEIKGPKVGDRADNVRINATPGEYMMDVPAVRHYGVGVMQAIHKRLIPKSMFTGVSSATHTRSIGKRSYADGGEIQKSGTSGVNVAINLTNNSGTAVSAKSTEPSWDGTKYVIGVVLDAMNRNVGGFRNNMKAAVK